jgi:hypothetical protein
MKTKKESNLSFADGFMGLEAAKAKEEGKKPMAFDWDKAAEIIKNELKNHSDLVAEAGLQGDWAYTGGVIFENGKPTNDEYTYLASTWATPSLLLMWDNEEQDMLACCTPISKRMTHDSKWDDKSLSILGIQLDK